MRVRFYGLILCASALMCSAQSKHYLIEETTIRADLKTQFEIAQGDYCRAVVRGGAPSCIVFAPTTFSKPDRYLTLLSFGSFAHYDEGTYTSKGLTPDQAKELGTRRAPTISSNEESGIQLRFADLANHDALPPILLVTELHLIPGKMERFLRLIREDAVPAARKNGAGAIEIYQTEANGDPDRIFLLQHLRNFADIDAADPLWSAIPNTQRAAFDDVFASCVRSSFVTVMRYRQDLSAFAR